MFLIQYVNFISFFFFFFIHSFFIHFLFLASTGIDPKSRRNLWKSIETAISNKKRSVILTTHSLGL